MRNETKDKDRELVSRLFGAVAPVNDNFNPQEFVNRPFATKEAIAHGLCLGCGAELELNSEAVDLFCKMAETIRPDDFQNAYFTILTCEICSDDCRDISLVFIS